MSEFIYDPIINYRRLAEAEDFYVAAGFQRVGAPWSVTRPTLTITAPKDAKIFIHKEARKGIKGIPDGEDLCLVASGEQSLLSLVKVNEFFNISTAGAHPLFEGRFVTTTPCFRDELGQSPYTRSYFMKVELFDNQNPTEESLKDMIALCHTWFSKHISCEVIETDQAKSDPIAISRTYDIVHNSSKDGQIELGSYGIRKHPSIGEWVYATGCAEPRLSAAIERGVL